jgi:hypothetical protein
VATRDQVLGIIRSGSDWIAAGQRLGIPPGLAYLIATGVPADGSGSVAPEDLQREGLMRGGSQALIGVPVDNPTEPSESPEVSEWVRERARADALDPEEIRSRQLADSPVEEAAEGPGQRS